MPKVRDDALRNNQRPLPEISAGRVVSRRGGKVRGTRGTSEGNEVGVSGGGRSVGQPGAGSVWGGVSPGRGQPGRGVSRGAYGDVDKRPGLMSERYVGRLALSGSV